MPGAKNPTGNASGGVDLIVDDLKLDPPLGATLKGTLQFAESPVTTVEPNVGKCKATLTTDKSGDGLAFAIEEPGCNVQAIASKPMADAFVATAKGTLVAGGSPVDVRFDLKPGDTTFDEFVKKKQAK
jgi:hypothetical protein